MECDICLRSPEEGLDFLCVACARNIAYLPRLQFAEILLERNALSNQVEGIVNKQSNNHTTIPSPSSASADQKVWQTELRHIQITERKRSLERTRQDQQQTKDESADLREQIKALKAKIAEKKAALTAIQDTIPQRRSGYLARLSSGNTKASSSFVKLQQRSFEDRAKLCREAASLMRLRQRRKQRDNPDREQYAIAGLTLPDLREISNLRCADLAAVLGSVTHLTLLVAFYLGIRLPAEITEPFADYPQHTILPPAGSYKGIQPEFPGVLASSSDSSSPSSSKHELGASLKPRPLFIVTANREERVFDFQKRDEQAFRFFVEGITLLAWNIAWLCRSQGFTVGTNSWGEICNVGHNLHQLLVANPQVSSINKTQMEKGLLKRFVPSRKAGSPLNEARKEALGKLGQNTDLSAVNQETKVSQRDLLTLWDLASWHKVALPLRKMLLTEIASAEWEILLDEEWDDGGEQFDEAVVVKARTLDGQQYDDARSISTTKSKADEEVESNARVPGTSGWTKLKSRDKTT